VTAARVDVEGRGIGADDGAPAHDGIELGEYFFSAMFSNTAR
jgi:hypothetical protein